MRSRQLALCAAVAACAVMAAPAYGVGVHGTGSGSGTGTGLGTGRNLVASAPYAPRTAPYALGRAASREATGCHAVWGAACPSAFATAVPPVRSAEPLAAGEAFPAGPRPTADAGPRHELSSTSAVGLVLAGGAVLVIAGQLLRLRLRLRRTRRGGADER